MPDTIGTIAQFIDTLDYYPARDLLSALQDAITHSNGLDFCETADMLALAALLTSEAARRGATPALA